MFDGPDPLDERLIAALRDSPRRSVSDLARTLSVARGTVQLRMDRLAARGIITGFGPDIDPGAAGYDVQAFTTFAISQGAHDRTVDHLASIPEIIEVHTVTGGGDLLARIVARNNDHLHEILQRIASFPEVTRTETHLALATPVQRTIADLIVERVSVSD